MTTYLESWILPYFAVGYCGDVCCGYWSEGVFGLEIFREVWVCLLEITVVLEHSGALEVEVAAVFSAELASALVDDGAEVWRLIKNLCASTAANLVDISHCV